MEPAYRKFGRWNGRIRFELAGEECHQLGNDLSRRLVDQPMAGAGYDHSFDIVIHHPALIDEKLSTGFFARKPNSGMDVRAEAGRFLSFAWSVRPGQSSRC